MYKTKSDPEAFFALLRATPARVAVGVGLIAFVLYLLTLAPTFGYIDDGELAAVASTLGIAHPTGYPTITLLGKLFTLIFPVSDIVALNVLAALFVATGSSVLTLLYVRLLRAIVLIRSNAEKGKKRKREKHKKIRSDRVISNGEISVLAGLSALITVTTGIWWRQSTGFEVYALHCLMLPLTLFLFFRYIDQEASRSGEEIPWDHSAIPESKRIGYTKRGFFFGLVLGLSFTNHMTTILLAPGLLLYYFWRLGFDPDSFRRLLYLIPSFVIGLLPYLWLPLRAASNPEFNWGNPETLWSFWRHVTGAQYEVWMFTEPRVFAEHTQSFLGTISTELLFVGMGIALLGIATLLRKERGLALCFGAILFLSLLLALFFDGENVAMILLPFIGLLLLMGLALFYFTKQGNNRQKSLPAGLAVMAAFLFLTSILYGGGYSILDIEQYYLTAILALGLWLLFGLVRLHDLFGRSIALAFSGFLAVGVVLFNYGGADESGNYLVEDATVNVLENAPENAIIISGLWDFWLSGSYYMQAVKEIRPDVTVVDHNLLKYGWYIDQLRANSPEFMALIKKEVDAFQVEQYKFERDLPYDSRIIDRLYVELIDAMIRENLGKRPVLVTFDLNERNQLGEFRYGNEWPSPKKRVPWHLTYMIVPEEKYVSQKFPDWKFRFWDGKVDPYVANTYKWYATSARDRAQYEALYGHDSLVNRYIQLAGTFDPGWDEGDYKKVEHLLPGRIVE